jgi:hypothetical protein
VKTRYLFITLAMAVGLILALLWLGSSSTPVAAATESQARAVIANVITVCASGGCDHSNVQAAVDAAGDGDFIKVAAGVYTGVQVRPRNDFTTTGVVTQVVYISKTVTVQGGYTTTNWTTPDPEANSTILDAEGQGRVFYVTGDISPTIGGLRITEGTAQAGGGIFVFSATATITGNWVYSNSATTFGGGIGLYFSQNAMLSENTITTNTSDFIGGGLIVDSCDNIGLIANRIAANASALSGGLHVYETDTNLIGNTFSANTVETGGGLTLVRNNSTLSGNVVSGNIASEFAGGVWILGGAPTLVNNVIADNHADIDGSGLAIEYSAARLLHTTIARNSGGGWGVQLVDGSTVILTNTIVSSHTQGINAQDGSTATLESTLWHANGTDYGNNVVHTHDYTGDPAFAADGYHLTPDSAAAGKGVDAGIPIDIDGDSRPDPIGTSPDLGADEVGLPRIYLPLVVRGYSP